MNFPLVSIVMPSYNQAQFIRMSIASVLEQSYQQLELIVADGGSNDGTQDILAEISRYDSRLRFFSRGDRGPAHAINYALNLVRGTTIGWLNSDDLYTGDAIARAMHAFAQQPNWLLVYGQGQHIDARGQIIGNYPSLSPSVPLSKFQQGCFICQPTLFFKRSAYLLLGPFDEGLQTSFDFDYWLRAFCSFSERIGFIDEMQAYSRLHADCITMRMRRTVVLEGMQVLARHLGYAAKEWLLGWVDETLKQEADDKNLSQLTEDFYAAIEEADHSLTASDAMHLRHLVTQRLKNASYVLAKRS